MKWTRSLRARVILGSLLWTAGLLFVSHLSAIALFNSSRIFRMSVHMGTVLTPIALLLMVAGLSGLRSGLSPFDRLRGKLASVRTGKAERVEGEYPNEVQPLVDDLNALLEHRERAVQRALATAGDLAHGLKTPLAVLAQEAERASAAGQTELANALGEQVDRMRRQVDYHLARARAAGSSPGARSSVPDAAEAIRRTLLRLHVARGLQVELEIPSDQVARCQREDLEEMLGNLMDNACKWARRSIEVRSTQEGNTVVVTVDDDGPGVPVEMRQSVLRRGVRADEAGPGSGLGLAIVRDLAELYRGSLELGETASGGLRATLRLPAA
jgi:signal transduction histidine kinase